MISTPWQVRDKLDLECWPIFVLKGISKGKNKAASLVLRHDKSRVRTASLFLSLYVLRTRIAQKKVVIKMVIYFP